MAAGSVIISRKTVWGKVGSIGAAFVLVLCIAFRDTSWIGGYSNIIIPTAMAVGLVSILAASRYFSPKKLAAGVVLAAVMVAIVVIAV